MFDILKKGFSNLVNALKQKKEEEKEKKTFEKSIDRANIENIEKPISQDISQIQEPTKTTTKIQQTQKQQEQKVETVKVGLTTKILAKIVKKTKLSESEINDTIENLELILLEADVSYKATEQLVEKIRKRLMETEFEESSIESQGKEIIKTSIKEILGPKPPPLTNLIISAQKKPYVILFFGLNGNGKTTTIAKIAKYLQNNKISSVISASDTFRAGAIEQLEVHSKSLGIPLISKGYNADPCSVAYDAINYAKSKNIATVLVDTAGRQETNINLLEELAKLNRVLKPDLKLYVVESIIGNAAVEQIKKFNEKIGLDGIILTKIDLDAKGGTLLSISYEANIPVFFVCDGQDYSDIKNFDYDAFVESLLS